MADEGEESESELSIIQYSFPELVIDPDNNRHATLELEVSFANPLAVTFNPPLSLDTLNLNTDTNFGYQLSRTHKITHLPPLQLSIDLPAGYPASQGPILQLNAQLDWLPAQKIEDLRTRAENTWVEDCPAVYDCIDSIRTEIDEGFHFPGGELALDKSLETLILDFDKQAKRQKFNAQSFDCNVCLSRKSGSACYQLERCRHVFCIECLQDFYNSAITEGDVSTIKCLDPDCGKSKKQRTLHPTELLDIPLPREQVQRYVNLKLKNMLESDKDTVYCPRKWCQGPARSAKYAKFDTRDLINWPEDDINTEPNGTQTPPATPPGDGPGTRRRTGRDLTERLSVCSLCGFAFCRVCNKSWHGDLVHCLPPSNDANMSSEDQASYDYIRLNTSPCPTCSSPCQKTHGCNHMRCFKCNTHFCYLCSSWLRPDNPYSHFNDTKSSCYMLLWELEEGDEGPAGGQQRNGVFGGARAAEMEAMRLAAEVAREADAHEAEEIANAAAAAAAAHGEANGRGQRFNQQGLQRFLEMAANDEEDGWDSDELEFEDERVAA